MYMQGFCRKCNRSKCFLVKLPKFAIESCFKVNISVQYTPNTKPSKEILLGNIDFLQHQYKEA